MGAAYVRFALDRPELFRLMFGGAVRGCDHPELAAAGARSFAMLENQIGGEAVAPARAIARWALVHGLAHLLLDGQISAVRDDRAAAERLVEAVLGGRPES